MDRNFLRFVWSHSRPQQFYMLALVLASWPLEYMLYEVPKAIINRAIGQVEPPFALEFYDVVFIPDMDQLALLAVLCGLFLFLVVAHNAFKYHLGVYQGRLSERLLRRLRYELYSRVLRFPLPHFRRVGQGEVVAMIAGQSEQVGNFAGAAIIDPVKLGGQLMVAAAFIVVQNPMLALAALALYPLQIWVVPMIQRRVAALARERQRQVRKLSDHISESMTGVQEVRAHGAALFELSRFSDRQGVIFELRYKIFKLRFALKFLNNFIDKLAPFFFYFIGGYFVIAGELTLGALVSVIAAHKEMGGPWKELLNWYNNQQVAAEIYEDIVVQFDPPGLQKEEAEAAPDPAPFKGVLALENASYVEDDGATRLHPTTLAFEQGRATALLGPEGGGKHELMLLLARFRDPSTGRVRVDGQDLAAVPAATLGRRMVYVGASAYLQSGTMRDTLLYALKQRPRRPGPERTSEADLEESLRAGNSGLDVRMDWVDWQAAAAADENELAQRVQTALVQAELEDDLYQIGLRSRLSANARPEVADSILRVRNALAGRLKEPEFRDLIESFDRERYNSNATVAENLLFGTADGDFSPDRLAANAHVVKLLRETGLYPDFLEIGRKVAETMVELFADIPPGHEFFQQFSFIDADDLPQLKSLLARAERAGVEKLDQKDTARLLALPFKLVPARHRLGLIDEPMQERLLKARHAFASGLPPELRGAVEFFDRARYNHGASVQDNILFGKLAFGQPAAAARIGALVGETLDREGARSSVIEAGLDFEIGVGGSRLSAVQRQKVALARALLRQGDVLLIDEGTAQLDSQTELRVLTKVLEARKGRTVVWALTRPELADHFDAAFAVEGGRVHRAQTEPGRKPAAAEQPAAKRGRAGA